MKKKEPKPHLKLIKIGLIFVFSFFLTKRYVKNHRNLHDNAVFPVDICIPDYERTREEVTPTPTPKTKTETKIPQKPPQSPKREKIEREIEIVFAPAGAENIAIAKRVVGCESGYNPRAESPGNYGLFQINQAHGYSKATLFNWKENIKIAYKLYQKNHGWGPWEPYSGHCWKGS